ncbi:MAG TPA: PEP-CTERM sorting domain-containing protein [Pirellulales bacterium]|jgi:hypothetical protein|nr:PEP-CTERM sorting domain-containing protein [Pirellulales bacterium]
MTSSRILVFTAFAAAALVCGNALASTVATVESTEPITSTATVAGQTIGDPGNSDPAAIVTAILNTPGTVNGFTTSSWAFLANDGTGSIDVFATATALSGFGYATPAVGDQIGASGSYSPFHQIAELGSLTGIGLIAQPGSTVVPQTATIPQLNISPQTVGNGNQEFLWTLHNVTITDIAGGNGTWGNGKTGTAANLSYTVTDSSSNSMVLFYWPTSYSSIDAAMYGQPIPTGPVDITGFMSVFAGPPAVPEFTPILVTPVPEPSAFVLGGLSLLGLLAARKLRASGNPSRAV